MPKRKSAIFRAFRPRLNSLRRKNTLLFTKATVQILSFLYQDISDEELSKIEGEVTSFLTENLFSKERIESILLGDVGTGILLLRAHICDEFDLKVKEKINPNTKQATFILEGVGIAKISYKHDFQIIEKGFEYCTGFFLYSREQQFCLAGHLPIDEANVIDIVDNILYPLFQFLKNEYGINLKDSKLLLCCGDDSANSDSSKDVEEYLPGELAYLRIKFLCSEMFKEIIFNEDHIIQGNDEVIFDSKQETLIINRYIAKLTHVNTESSIQCAVKLKHNI